MVVGAHYRNRGNVVAALTVINAMVEVMLGIGTNLAELKPAMLMISSCHLDIAKHLRAQAGTETTESKDHFDKACEGLRTVYGSFVPPPATSSDHSRPLLSSMTETSSPGGTSPKSSLSETLGGNANRLRSPEPIRSSSEVEILKREVQSLRDRQSSQAQLLGRKRLAKRQMEDELDTERRVRRRLERRLEQAETAALGSQKRERLAAVQCRAEAETRRQAEERMEETEQEMAVMRAALEPKLAVCEEREQKFKDFCGRMGVVFLKAARGEFGEVLNGRT
ncbi:hypothetical protein BD414DRAFT_411164 [Trametes punicea]|nr:hypothetical protein BD414DRAFT_411164 [Trametes punicea]